MQGPYVLELSLSVRQMQVSHYLSANEYKQEHQASWLQNLMFVVGFSADALHLHAELQLHT